MLSGKDKEKKIVVNDVEIFLAEMGFFNDLWRKKIKFNPKPFSKHTQLSIVEEEKPDDNIVDLHLEIVKQIDELLERQAQVKELEPVTQKRLETPLTEFIEIRDSPIKRPIMPQFQTEIEQKKIFGEVYQNVEFFDTDVPDQNHFIEKNGHPYDRDINSRMLGGYDRKSQKPLTALGKIKVKSKTAPQKTKETSGNPNKVNGYTKTKIELERTKKEIEAKERALKEAIQKEKEKEEELKTKAEEKKKQDKLRKIELKKRMKQKKLREKEEEKLRKQKEKEMKKLEAKRLTEERIKQKEREKRKLLKDKELEKLEKEKLTEEKIKQKEKEKLKLEKEKELKRLEQEKLKQQKLKETELEKARKQKERELKEKLKEKEKLKKQKKEKKKEKKVKVKKEEEPTELSEIAEETTEEISIDEMPMLDNDVEKLLPILDQLLEKLPDEVVDEFAQSDDFALYEKVMSKYKHK